ncbi:MAG: type II toxin-antitoxin system VapC family toxin [Promethearchaeota archaeon]
MRLYLDTSAILSYYDKSSIFFENAVKLFHYPEMELFTSMITVLEMESVIGRNIGSFYLEIDPRSKKLYESLSNKEKIPIITQYFIKRLGISIESASSIEKCEINDKEYDIFNTFNLALRMNREMNLRTLDALQIASAVEIKIYNNIDIEYFVTNDSIILKRKQKLYQRSRILPISTDDLAKLLDI